MTKKPFSRRDFLKASAVTGIGAVLAACAPQTTSTTTAGSSNQQSQPTTAPQKGGDVVTISFMGWGEPEEDEGVKNAIAQFEKEQSEVKVTWLHTPDQYAEKFLASVAAGTPPDTAFVGSDVFRTYARDALLLDITNQLKSDPLLGAKDYFIEPQEEQRCTYNGKWYGIGSCWVAYHIYYNAETFEKAGIEPPSNDPAEAWDWDKFVQVCQQLTVDKNGKTAADSGFDNQNIERWAVSYPLLPATFHGNVASVGQKFVDMDTQRFAFDTPEAMEAIQKTYDLSVKYHVSPTDEMTTQLGMSTSQMLENGKLAMAVDGSWALSWMYKIKGKLGTAVLPKMKNPATDMQAHIHCAMKASKYPDAAWKWVRFLSTPYYQTQFCKIGLWLPSQTALMTADGLKTWVTPGVHPDGYEKIVTQYVPKYGDIIYMPPGYPKTTQILQPAWDKLRVGEGKAEDILPGVVAEANKILEEEAAKA